MGEFHQAVLELLHAFSSGISIIKTQRGRRTKEKVPIDPTRKAAETDLSKSLKRSRKEVKSAYERDASVIGPGFRVGDEEAYSSLNSILRRLNAGYVNIIERFTRGKSSQADYQALINLSNSSRIEAMRTFEQLSKRMSQSSLVLAPSTGDRHKRKRKSSKKGTSSKSKSSSSLTVTPLGVANTEGWVRPKPGRKSSSESRTSSSSKKPTPKLESASNTPKVLPAPRTRSPVPVHPAMARNLTPSPPVIQRAPPPANQNRTVNRKSIMSFASDSTKLGEIPEYKWMRPGMFDVVAENGDVQFPITMFYPTQPYQEPEKPRSRLRKLFRM